MEDVRELFRRLVRKRQHWTRSEQGKNKVIIGDRAGKLANVICNIPGSNIVDHYMFLQAPKFAMTAVVSPRLKGELGWPKIQRSVYATPRRRGKLVPKLRSD